MKILFLGLGVPDLDKSLNLHTRLVMEIHKNGHQIDVVGPAFDKEKTGLRKEAGINVIRVPTLKLFKVGYLEKGLANLLLPLQYKKALKNSSLDLNYDLVMMPTPPISLVFLAKWLKKKYNSKIYLVLRDIFPQNALDLNILSKKNPLYHFFRYQETLLYDIVDSIGCMSQGNINYVIEHNPSIDKRKLHMLPNWRTLLPLAKDDEVQKIRKTYGLEGKLVVIFGGNIGLPQKVENIVALMEKTTMFPEILYLIVGDGNEKKKLEDLIATKNLNNVKLSGKISELEFHLLLQAADIGLISLSEKFTIPNIPSKTLAYFNAKLPILASTDVNTDYPQILKESGAGIWSEAGKPEELKNALCKLREDGKLRLKMGENGYNYLKNHLTTDKAYLKLINALGAAK